MRSSARRTASGLKPLLQGLALIGALVVRAEGQELIAHWTMDEAAVVDATGNGHDAAWGEAEGEVVEGMVGGALEFVAEEQHYLEAAESGDFNFDGPFTVMAWVKPARRNAAFAICCMKGDKSGDPPWPGWRLRFFWARSMLQVGTPDGEEPSVSSDEWSVAVGFWTHVAASWDGEHLRIFTNAVERAATEFSGTIAPQSRALVIGNYIGRKDAYAFDGLIDDVRIYSGALTEDQIFRAARPQ